MGGTALKGIITRRVSIQEYIDIENEVYTKLSKYFINRVHKIPYYKEKESFGDLDLVVMKPKMDKNKLIKILITEFESYNYYFNSDVISFDYKNFQVDLIFVDKVNLETSINYLSYNDINNLIGVVAKQFNLKHSHKGLLYIYRGDKDSGYFKKEIVISKNLEMIYSFIGYDYKKYQEGFNNLNDIIKMNDNEIKELIIKYVNLYKNHEL